jgi:hypothetical protein
MTKPKISVAGVIRDMNDEELAQYELDQISIKAEQIKLAEAADKKAALLAKLGITADEAKLLLS